MISHYKGGAQKEKCTATALATLKALHYKNESLFSCEDFSCQLLNAYHDLDGTRDEITPYSKVKEMLAKIDLDTPRIEVAKPHVRSHHSEDLDEALAYLGTEFSEIFASAVVYKRSHSQINAIGNDRNVRPRMEDAPTHCSDGTHVFYGVDVTDVHRYFTDQEMSNLGPRGQAYVFEQCLAHPQRGRNSSRGAGWGRGCGGGRTRTWTHLRCQCYWTW